MTTPYCVVRTEQWGDNRSFVVWEGDESAFETKYQGGMGCYPADELPSGMDEAYVTLELMRKKTMLVVMNHKLTAEQEADARRKLKVTHFVYLPEDLRKIWSNLDPILDAYDQVAPICQWVYANMGDAIVLIQGAASAQHYLVNYCHKLGMDVYCSNTRRESREELSGNAVVKKSVFRHVRFEKILRFL